MIILQDLKVFEWKNMYNYSWKKLWSIFNYETHILMWQNKLKLYFTPCSEGNFIIKTFVFQIKQKKIQIHPPITFNTEKII